VGSDRAAYADKSDLSATGPGETALDGDTGGNSLFTRALLAHIAAPGVEIQQAMTQVRADVSAQTSKQQLPWGHTNLTGSVYVNPAGAPLLTAAAPADVSSAAPAPAPAAAPVAAAAETEIEFWRSIRATRGPPCGGRGGGGGFAPPFLFSPFGRR